MLDKGSSFENIQESLTKDLIKRITSGLVRVQDIVDNRSLFGGITESDRSFINNIYKQGISEGIDPDDVVTSLETLLVSEEFIAEISPIAPITPVPKLPTTPKPPGTAPMTTQAVSQTQPAANVQVGQQPNTQPINPQNLEKEIGNKLKDPTFGKDFAELLAKVMQRK